MEMYGLRNLDSGFNIYIIDSCTTVKLRKAFDLILTGQLCTEPITIKFKAREKNSKPQPITTAVCGLISSRLIGFFHATKDISGFHVFLSFTVINILTQQLLYVTQVKCTV